MSRKYLQNISLSAIPICLYEIENTNIIINSTYFPERIDSILQIQLRIINWPVLVHSLEYANHYLRNNFMPIHRFWF